MLLLVLILILIAFGLLVVALLSGSVLWAWVSVAVSAVAALVLVVDALQRRAAVRAGAQGDGVPPERALPELDPPEVEPVTEILPVVPPGATVGEAAAGAGEGSGIGPESGFGQAPVAQRTVVMPPLQPSGSAERPSGAAAPSTPSGDSALPSVTETGVDSGPDTPPVDPPRRSGEAPAAEGGGGQATVAVSPRELSADLAEGGPPTGSPPADPGDRVDRSAPAETGAPTGSAERPPDRKTGVEPSDPTLLDAPPADVVPSGAAPDDVPAGPDQGIAPDVGLDTVLDTAPDTAPDEEPPEETRESTVAAIVALLPDEVVVVDEQPRYHLTGCRALATKPVIPLPVREAVELGFTPCGWCGPDRTLAERHPARAQ